MKKTPCKSDKKKKERKINWHFSKILMSTMSFFKSKSIKYWIDKVELQVKWFPIKRVPDVVRFIHHWCGEWSAPGEKHQPGASSYPDPPTHTSMMDDQSLLSKHLKGRLEAVCPCVSKFFYSSSDTRVTSSKSTLLGAHMHWVPAAKGQEDPSKHKLQHHIQTHQHTHQPLS